MKSIPLAALSLSTWAPKSTPTTTSLSYVDPTNFPALTSSFDSATSAVWEQTDIGSLYHISQVVRGVEASLTIIEAQSILATATNEFVKAECTEAIFLATLNLKNLEKEENPYGEDLSLVANTIFTALFGLLFLFHLGMTFKSQYWYFGICVVLGCGLEFAGYLARCLAISFEYGSSSYFLCQIISITIAPAFVMAGVYYLLGKFIVVHGRNYSVLKPIRYAHIFILCDILSLCIQGAGGGVAATSVLKYKSPVNGTHIMVAGIAFQVFSMTMFLWFLFDFIVRIYFFASPEVEFSVKNVSTLLFNSRSTGYIRDRKLEPYYDPQYKHIRDRRYFGNFACVLVLVTVLVYIRCIYRVVELSYGWTGYLITHEVYLMCLDALMLFSTCCILLIFHPLTFFGRHESIPLRQSKFDREQEKRDNETEAQDAESLSRHTSIYSNLYSVPRPEKTEHFTTYSYSDGSTIGDSFDADAPAGNEKPSDFPGSNIIRPSPSYSSEFRFY